MRLTEIFRNRHVQFIEWHVRKRSELESLGFPSMQIYLHRRRFYLVSVDRNPIEAPTFERWCDWTREEHNFFMRKIDRQPDAFIEIPQCPDDFDEAEWLTLKAAE